jgi:hypothetical protein
MVEVEPGSFSSASLSENSFDYSHRKSEKCGKRKHNQRRYLETSSEGKRTYFVLLLRRFDVLSFLDEQFP